MRAIFLDMETTGLDPLRHRAIDLAFKIFDVTANLALDSYQSIIKITPEAWELRDPSSVEINGFTWEQIQTGKEISAVKEEVVQLFTNLQVQRGHAVFICQNPSFDRGFFSQVIPVYMQEQLQWPYHWLDLASMYWALLNQKCHLAKTALPEKLILSKNEIAKEHQLPIEMLPHRAMKGVEHLILCYEAVLGVKLNGF